MIKKESRNSMRLVRHSRIRKQVSGTSNIPRLCVYRSNLNISAQLIDDENRVTLASASSKNYKGNNIEVAKLVEEAKKLNINKVVFDRGGYLYHGKVQALADAARSKGLEF